MGGELSVLDVDDGVRELAARAPSDVGLGAVTGEGVQRPPVDWDAVFVEVWTFHSRELFRCCLRRMNGDRGEAEEAFSRVALKVYGDFPRHYRQVVSLRSWLLRLAHNVCMDIHRERRRERQECLVFEEPEERQVVVEALPVAAPDPERRLLQRELQSALHASIGHLPARLRRTTICYLRSASYREVAENLCITEAAARKRMQEVRVLLAPRLAAYRSGDRSARLLALPRRPSVEVGGEPSAPEATSRAWFHVARRSVLVTSLLGAETEAVLRFHQSPGLPGEGRRLERYVADHPGGWKGRLELAHWLAQEGRIGEAADELERVVAKRPLMLEPWLELVDLQRARQDAVAVAAVLQRAVEAVAGPERSLVCAALERARGRHDEALQALELAEQSLPQSSLPAVALAELHRDAGRPTEAAAALERALLIQGGDAVALALAADLLPWVGRARRARELLGRLVASDAKDVAARLRLVGLGAEPTRGELERLAPSHAAALRLLAQRLAEQEEPDSAVELLARQVREHPRRRDLWWELARFLGWIGRPGLASRALDAAIALGGPGREDRLLRIRLQVRGGRQAGFHGALMALVETYPGDWEVLSTAAWAAARMSRRPSPDAAPEPGLERMARDLLSAALELQPRLPIAWLENGQTLSTLGDLEAAREALERAWALVPGDDGDELAVSAAIELASVHGIRGEVGEVSAWVRRGLARAEALRAGDPTAGRLAEARLRWQEAGGAVGSAPGPRIRDPAFGLAISRNFTMQVLETSLG